MQPNSDNWQQSVGGTVMRGGKILLVRHTYGKAAGRLLIPGGYVKFGETPQDAFKRELLEETGIVAEPLDIIAIRFNSHDWYIAFRAEYIRGEARSDNNENSEVLWLEPDDALQRSDVTNMSKILIARANNVDYGLIRNLPYETGDASNPPLSLYL